MNSLLSADGAPLLIGGKLIDRGGAGVFSTVNPATEEELGQAADADAADMDAAIAAARRAFDDTDWSRDHAFRAHCLTQLRTALQ
ncbi:aldehyde dehydrogenase family protein, partial [Nocardia cyriacigeorgica]